MKHWVAMRLRYLADRIDSEGAVRWTGYSFTFERKPTGRGLVFTTHQGAHRGCTLWYYGKKEYERAWDEAIDLVYPSCPKKWSRS